MTEEEIVKEVCKMMDVHYSHYDNHRMSLEYFRPIVDKLPFIPKIVVYSEPMGMWQFAILEDMSIYTRGLEHNEVLLQISALLKTLNKDEIDKQSKKITQKAEERNKKYEDIKKWLKENKHNKVINNPNKKINWC